MRNLREQQVEALLGGLAGDAARFEAAGMSQWEAADWGGLLRLARHSGVLPMLNERLSPAPLRSHVPEAIRYELHQSAQQAAMLNLQQTSEQTTVLRALNAAQVQGILLKGAYLRIAVYETPAARPMGDLDLLVKETDLGAAGKALEALGYKPSPDEEGSQRIGHLAYAAPGKRLPVEVHWKLEGASSIQQVEIHGIWQRAREAWAAGVPVLGLANEDLLLHLCLHAGSRHLFCQAPLRGLVDLCEVLRKFGSELDWDTILRRAHEWKMSHSLVMSLRLAEDLLGAPLPAEVSRLFAQQVAVEPLLQDMLAFARQQVLAQAAEEAPAYATRWVGMWSAPTHAGRLKSVWQSLFPRRAALAGLYRQPMDAWYLPLYYFIRPLDLVRRWAGRGLGLLSGKQEAHNDFAESQKYEELKVFLRQLEPDKISPLIDTN